MMPLYGVIPTDALGPFLSVDWGILTLLLWAGVGFAAAIIVACTRQPRNGLQPRITTGRAQQVRKAA